MMTASAWPVLALLWPLGEPSLLKLGTMREKWDLETDFGRILGFFFPSPSSYFSCFFFFLFLFFFPVLVSLAARYLDHLLSTK